MNISDCAPTATIFLGDFNAKNSEWWSGDTSDLAGIELLNLANQHGLRQLIDKPTHILPNSSSCIDLIFSAENNVLESGVLSSLHPRCHHQIPYCKINFRIPFPPSYKRKIWNFSRANSTLIQRAMNEFDWDGLFEGLDVNGRVSLLTETITNIFSQY